MTETSEASAFDMQALRMSLLTGLAAGLGTLGLYMYLSSGDDNETETAGAEADKKVVDSSATDRQLEEADK